MKEREKSKTNKGQLRTDHVLSRLKWAIGLCPEGAMHIMIGDKEFSKQTRKLGFNLLKRTSGGQPGRGTAVSDGGKIVMKGSDNRPPPEGLQIGRPSRFIQDKGRLYKEL